MVDSSIYMVQEILNGYKIIKADIWSLDFVLYEFLNGIGTLKKNNGIIYFKFKINNFINLLILII